MRKIWIGLGLGLPIAGAIAGWSIYHTFVKQSRTFVFANWENYMSPVVQDYLADKYDVGFTTYGNNSDLIGLYVDGSYDAAIPSDYLVPQLAQSGALEQIDWSQFKEHGVDLLAPDQMPDYYDDQESKLVAVYNNKSEDIRQNDPINLFNDIVKRQIAEFRSYDGSRINLLKYGVPYFMQDLVFAYRGPTVPALADPDGDYTWEDVMANSGSFKNGMKIIDDERNIYSIGRSIETKGDNSVINPTNSADIDLNGAFQAFGKYANNLGDILWDTDSYQVLDYLSQWEDGEAPRAAILYNGDAVYAAQGGEVDAGTQNSDTFHIVHPVTTVFVMDLVTISSKINKANLPKMMALVDELALSGVSIDPADPTAGNPDYQAEGPDMPWAAYIKDDTTAYLNLSMQNFDNVNYVSPLRDMSDNASDYYSDSDEYAYGPDGDKTTIFYSDLYKDDDGNAHVAQIDPTTGAVSDGGVPADDYDGPLLYVDGDQKNQAASATGRNVQAEIYKIQSPRIKSGAIEVPFTDEQQLASIRYFADLKYRIS